MTIHAWLSLIMLLWLLIMMVLGPLYMMIPPSPDQSQFDWMAFIATQGKPYYAASFDVNWPGAMFLHEAGIRLFGVHAWTWRLTDFLLLIGFTTTGAMFLARSGWRLAPIFFLFLYPLLYTTTAPYWLAGQRDIIASAFLIVAGFFALPGRRHEGVAALITGAFVGVAVLIRPTFLSFFLGLMVLEVLPLRFYQRQFRGRIGWMIRVSLGFAAIIGTAVAVGLVQGNLDDWYQQSFEFALSVYVGDPPQDWYTSLLGLFVQSWHWITLLGMMGIAIWVRLRGLDYALLILLGVIATTSLSFIVQGKGFGYHLSGTLICLVLFMAVALDGLEQVRRTSPYGPRRVASVCVLLLAALVVITGTTKKLLVFSEAARNLIAGELKLVDGYGLKEDERSTIVSMIRENSLSNDTIAIYGTNYELAYRAERLPTYRYFTPAADQTSSSFRHHEHWIAEIDAALTNFPPAFVIIDRKMIEGAIEAPRPKSPDRIILGRLTALISTGYDVEFVNDRLVVYRATS